MVSRHCRGHFLSSVVAQSFNLMNDTFLIKRRTFDTAEPLSISNLHLLKICALVVAVFSLVFGLRAATTSPLQKYNYCWVALSWT